MKIIYGDSLVTIKDALFITFIGLSIVFSILILLSLILSLLKYVPESEEKKVKKDVKKVSTQENTKFDVNKITDEKMLAAIIVATMEEAKENDGAYIKVRNVKEI